MVVSPLTGSTRVELIREYDVDYLCKLWEERFAISVRREFGNLSHFSLYRCRDSELRFFEPRGLCGSAKMYEQLQKLPLYYADWKWEFAVALRDLPVAGAILEVGCGEGNFLSQLPRSLHERAVGLELNPVAASTARQRGLNVLPLSVEQLAAEKENSYDAVCAFQVLEHVGDPRTFLVSCVRLLRVGGRLVLGVPNADGYLRYADEILDLPPHHVTQWNRCSLEFLTSIFPIRMKTRRYQPLARGEISSYCEAARLRAAETGSWFGPMASTRLGRALMWRSLNLGIYRFLRGHSVYACFEKTSSVL